MRDNIRRETSTAYPVSSPILSLLKVSALACGISCVPLSVTIANEWSFVPYIDVSEQYTDNAFGSSTDEKSDFITTFDTGFKITGETLRTDLSVSYNISQDYYAHNHELDGYRQRFLGIGNIELVSDRLFVDSRITFTEETLSSAGATSATDRTQSSDRTQVFNGEISPYYVHNFAGWALGIARYSYSEAIFSEPNVGADSSNPSDSHTNEIQLDLTSSRRFTNLKWAFENGLISSEDELGKNFVHISSLVNGQVPLNRYFSLIGTMGYDDFDADGIDDDEVSGLFGGAGVRFHPNSRTDLSVQVGHRFGDPIFDIDASYSPTSLDTLTASYSVSVQTANQSLVDTDILDEQGELIRPNFTVTDYVDDVTKSEKFIIQWNGSRKRNSYGLSGNLIKREFLSDDSDDLVLSLNANIGRQLTPRADVSLNTGFSEVLEGQTTADEDTTYTFGATYQYNFGNGLAGTAAYNFLNRDSKSGGDLLENAITLSIRKTF